MVAGAFVVRGVVSGVGRELRIDYSERVRNGSNSRMLIMRCFCRSIDGLIVLVFAI